MNHKKDLIKKYDELEKLKAKMIENNYPGDFVDEEEIYISTYQDNIINYLYSNFIDKYKNKLNAIENRLECIKGENDLSIKKPDNKEAYSLIDLSKEIKGFLNDLEAIKNYISTKKDNRLFQVDEKTGVLLEVTDSNIVDDIKKVCLSYLQTYESIGKSNAFGNGMENAYRIIFSLIKDKEK